MPATAQIGVYGLGPMGRGLALNFADKGATVVAFDPWTEARSGFRDRPAGLLLAEEAAGFVAALVRPRAILIMVKAGEPTDAAMAVLAPLLDPGDVLIDGGNAFWRDTERRARTMAARGLGYLGLGVSGGEEGARHGPALMAGGDRAAYERAAPLLRSIAARAWDDLPCCAWLGRGGAGHFVKMIHNGIEYAEMQAIAEAYLILRHGLGLPLPEVQAVFARWAEGPLDSYLIGITADILSRTDDATGRPLIDVIDNRVGQKGTGGWAAQAALELGVVAPSLAAAVFARNLTMIPHLPWDDRPPADRAPAIPDIEHYVFIEAMEPALKAVRHAVLAQGLSIMAAASETEGWGLQLYDVLRVWRAGCIIRSRSIDEQVGEDAIENMDDSEVRWSWALWSRDDGRAQLRSVLMAAQGWSIPMPVMASALAYLDGLCGPVLGANLIAAQRDYFGAHGYKRIDGEGLVHTDWTGSRE